MSNEGTKATAKTDTDEIATGPADVVAFWVLVSIALLLSTAMGWYLFHKMPEEAAREEATKQWVEETWVRQNRMHLAKFEEMAWQTGYEDRFIALESGHPGVERCHYTLIPPIPTEGSLNEDS